MLNQLDPLGDGISTLALINYMGSDLDVVNDAKASFDRSDDELTEKGKKLIAFLAEHEHTSPFRGVVFKFKVKAPLYVARQWWKHVIASNHNDEQCQWNETSLRYVQINEDAQFYIPQHFRQQSPSNRQATVGAIPDSHNDKAIEIYNKAVQDSFVAYRALLELGVGREQARGVLVPCVYTSWVWTVSLQALIHFIKLRLGEGAQGEIQQYAKGLATLIQPIVPVTMKTLGLTE